MAGDASRVAGCFIMGWFDVFDTKKSHDDIRASLTGALYMARAVPQHHQADSPDWIFARGFLAGLETAIKVAGMEDLLEDEDAG